MDIQRKWIEFQIWLIERRLQLSSWIIKRCDKTITLCDDWLEWIEYKTGIK